MTQSGPIVQNVVSFAKMNMDNPELDLKLFAEKVQNSRYNKKRFPAVILRKTDPKSIILVFKSGKMIIIGSESEKDAEKVARKTVRDISKTLSIKAKISDFKVTNIVANAQIGWPIDIIKIADEKEGLKDESFPGVVYRGIKEVKAALLFSSGKVVFTGATERILNPYLNELFLIYYIISLTLFYIFLLLSYSLMKSTMDICQSHPIDLQWIDENINKYIYEDEFNEQIQMHGYGALYQPFGTYKGYFTNNKKHGDGEYVFNNLNKYKGQYQNGLKHGNGVLLSRYEEVLFNGQWQNDMPQKQDKLRVSKVEMNTKTTRRKQTLKKTKSSVSTQNDQSGQ